MELSHYADIQQLELLVLGLGASVSRAVASRSERLGGVQDQAAAPFMMSVAVNERKRLQRGHPRTKHETVAKVVERGPLAGSGLSPAALKRVQLFVEGNLHRPIKLRDLASRAGLSLHHFARAFRTSMSVTPRAYVEGRRIERAQHLLERSNRPIADIALDCGFNSQSQMTTTFRRRTGFTPAAFRKNRHHGRVPKDAI